MKNRIKFLRKEQEELEEKIARSKLILSKVHTNSSEYFIFLVERLKYMDSQRELISEYLETIKEESSP